MKPTESDVAYGQSKYSIDLTDLALPVGWVSDRTFYKCGIIYYEGLLYNCNYKHL